MHARSLALGASSGRSQNALPEGSDGHAVCVHNNNAKMAAILQPRVSRNGPERFVLAVALVMPLAVMAVAIAQLTGISITPRMARTEPLNAATSAPLVTHRPAAQTVAAPPTLVAPTVTPVPPTPTVAPVPTAAPAPRTYTVKRGDELKHIAADYGVSIWSIIDANDIPNPDSLHVGQVLEIPSN
jgi:LysM repeat protein